MDPLLNSFLGLMEDEAGLWASLLADMQAEKRAVVASDLKQLNHISKSKENVILKIRIMEAQREKMLAQIAGHLAIPPGELTLETLAGRLAEPLASRLAALRSKLRALIASIRDLNQSNRVLLQQSLELVRGSLSVLDGLINPHPIYVNTGRLPTADQGGRMLSGRV